jgi:D-sedoheptulose 7-phosphate isomerase
MPKSSSKLLLAHFGQLSELLHNVDVEAVLGLVAAIKSTLETGGTIYTFGNGGSASTALHFTNDLIRASKRWKPRIRCLNANVSVLTALGNDHGYDRIYSDQLEISARNGDLTIAISASGKSANCVQALIQSQKMGVRTACLVGFDGGNLLALSETSVLIRSNSYELIEDVHLAIAQAVAWVIETSTE